MLNAPQVTGNNVDQPATYIFSKTIFPEILNTTALLTA